MNKQNEIDLIAEAERLINFQPPPKRLAQPKKKDNLNFWLETSLIMVGLLLVVLLMQV